MVRAFPSVAIDDKFGGMTLRDWFAGQALASLSHPQNPGIPQDAAEYAYLIADAMLAARAQVQP